MLQLQLPVGFLGPYGVADNVKVYYDQAIDLQEAYCIGGMEADTHYLNFVPERDTCISGEYTFKQFDFRLAKAQDQCPLCQQPVVETKGIEVGHIFQLGDKYTRSMNVTVVDEQGKNFHPLMGCYGIGVTRTLAATIEQNNDQHGIIWPVPIAPFHIHLVVIGKKENILQVAEEIYQDLQTLGLEVLLDDRKLSPGVMLKDADLLGLPLRVVLGERDYTLDGSVEIKIRRSGISEKCPLALLPQRLQELLGELGTVSPE